MKVYTILFDFVDIGIYLQCTMVVADGVIVGDSGSTWQFPAVCTDFSHILVIFLSLCNFVNIFVILISLRIFFLFFWFLLPYLIRVNTYRQFFNIFFFSCWGFQPAYRRTYRGHFFSVKMSRYKLKINYTIYIQ